MAAIKSVNIDRIMWCIRDRGITVGELAAELKINEEKLNAVLEGEAQLSLGQLKSLAKYFNRGMLFFVADGEVNETKLRTSGFRTLTNEYPHLDPHIKALMERVERQRQIFLNLREELGEDDIIVFRPPAVPKDHPKVAANIIRNWLAPNGDRSFDSYRRALDSKGVLVFRSNGYIGDWRVPKESEVVGFSIYHKQFPVIFVRKQDAKQRELFTLAHELGHLVLHGAGSVDNEANLYAYRGKEKEVNTFAGNLLVPDEVLNRIRDREKPTSANQFETWLRHDAQQCGVSVEVVLRRLLDSNFVNRNEYQAYREWKGQQTRPEGGRGARSYRYREPVHVFGRPFVGTVLGALGSKQITIVKASRYLDNIKIADVHKLEREFNAF